MLTRRFALLLIVLTLLPLPAAAQSQPFTLEQIMSSPFPTGLVAAPSGGKLAWVFNARGVRNIWLAEPPDYKARSLTAYSEDDGQEISDLAFTPDAAALVFVRGGSPNRQDEYPNPTSNPEGVEQAIWMVSLSGGTPRRLAEGSAPALSPRGDRVAYLHKNQIWSVPLDGSEKPAQLFRARGQVGSLRWSPDPAGAGRLAFVSSRGDHSFIGVYELGTKKLRWLDPSTDRDTNPAWSPDGTRIAFIRLPATSWFFSFGPRREGQPWSIRIADVSTGVGREIWKAAEGPGSVFHGVAAENQLLWVAGDWLVFPWERTDWTLLYSVPVRGGEATLLTPGEFEVEHVALGPEGKNIIFSSNQDDIDRRHIWRVTLRGPSPEGSGPQGGERPTPATSGTGIEWSPAVTSDGKAMAFFRSDARRPAHPAIIVGSAPPRELAPGTIPADFPTNPLVEPRPVVIVASDGIVIHGQLFLPGNHQEGERHPAVVFFHGGPRRQMLLGWHYLAYYHNAYALNQYLASRGYVVLSVNFRSGTGYGLDFRQALNYGPQGASEFNDVLGAGLYLRSRPDVDPARIGLWGGSYGGYLTAMGLARASDLFAAGVDIHGVNSWNIVIRNFEPSYDPRRYEDLARLAFDSSPMASISTWRSPVLLIHGDDDRSVPFSETVDLAEQLRKEGVTLEQLIFPDEVHIFLLDRSWLAAYRAAADFFDRYLKKR